MTPPTELGTGSRIPRCDRYSIVVLEALRLVNLSFTSSGLQAGVVDWGFSRGSVTVDDSLLNQCRHATRWRFYRGVGALWSILALDLNLAESSQV